ncbi:MAG: hypothetical protein AB1779_03045 [Candidatus Thermoplasmatota archaeon]
MKKIEIAPHVDEVVRALGNKIEREKIENELVRYIDEFRVPIDQAKRSIVRKYGGVLELQDSIKKKLSELDGNETNLELTCRIVSVNEKIVEIDGEKRKIFYGILGDETATRAFTGWVEKFPYAKGEIITIQNAYTKDWQGEAQINFGERSNIKREEKDKLPIYIPKQNVLKVVDFKSGIGNIETTVRIIKLEKREVRIGDGKKVVFSGLVGDETGKARFSAWHEFNLREGEAIKISGAYIKTWKGMSQLVFDERACVEKLKNSSLPPTSELLKNELMPIEKIKDNGYTCIRILGTVLEVKTGSGIIQRCKDCRRTMKNGVCAVHGKNEGVIDLRIKAVVDDGTGAIIAVLNKENAEKILGKSTEACKEIASIDKDRLVEEIEEKIVANQLLLTGNVLKDDFGTMFIASDVELINLDTKKIANEAKELLDSISEEVIE